MKRLFYLFLILVLLFCVSCGDKIDNTDDNNDGEKEEFVSITGLEDGIKIKAEALNQNSSTELLNEVKAKYYIDDNASYFGFDISLYKDEVEYKLEKEVSVKVVIPEEFLSLLNNSVVYHIHDGSVEKIEITINENMISFTVDSFSKFLLTKKHEHNFELVEKEPTCVLKGYTKEVCVCGEERNYVEKDELGHNFEDGVCTRCGDKDPDFVIDEGNTITNLDVLKSFFESMDANPNFKMVTNETIVYDDYNKEQLSETDYINVNEMLIEDGFSSPVYVTIDEYKQVVVNRELMVGSGYSKDYRYYSNTIFDTGYLLYCGRSNMINYTLSELFKDNIENAYVKEEDGEKKIVIDSVRFSFNMQYAMEYYYATKSPFAGFKKNSYDDIVLSDFTITAYKNETGIESLKISYKTRYLMAISGSSGYVDFEFSSEDNHYVKLEFSNFGTISVTKPSGIK